MEERLGPGRVGGRLWFWVVVLGLTGQLAWTVENMYLNVFVYDTITDSPTVLAALVASSALAATLATILVGAWSDRVGRRRVFIAAGYLLWGVSTAAFGLVSPEALGELFPAVSAVTLAIVAIVLLDCVMSILGAGANDAAFNAWVTDSTTPSNRGKVDGVLATMPLLGMLVVFGALDPMTHEGEWLGFFAIVGGVTAAVGILVAVGLRDRSQPRPSGSYLSGVAHGLRPRTMRAQPRLYVLLLAWLVIGTSSQVFLPFLIIYVQRYLRIDDYPIVLAAVLVSASAISVVGGRVLDRVGPLRGLVPLAGAYVLGLLATFVARGMVPIILAGTLMMSGLMLSIAAISASVRNETPVDRAGEVQGLRMVFAILVPMVVGPFIGAAVISGADETYVDLGVTKQVPTPWIFVAAAVVAALVILPARALRARRPAEDDLVARPVSAP